ncbi:MAG: nitroreductase family protein [Thermodesulfobacteriota bacterium]|nr:nitroreductase family protein [Thermodesulfobacteriota bacterium]
MSLFSIDQEKCVKDGICAAECPIKIIDMQNGFPAPVRGAEALCINCGHCVAVCPTGALSHKNLKPEECLEIKKEWLHTPEQTEHFLRSRRSIRNYKDKQVDKETMEKVINIASHAPSGHNRQPVQWKIIYNREEVQRLSSFVIDWMKWIIKEQPDLAKPMHLDLVVAGWDKGIDTISRNTPHLVIAHGNKKDPTAQAACTIALTYMELAMPSLELGGCWCGFFNAAATFWPPLQKELNFPKGNVNYGTMMVGYPKYRYQRIPPRNKAIITWQ